MFRQRYPQLSQVACFDTTFHHTLPRMARLLPVPRRFDTMSIQCYELHGLSNAYLMQALEVFCYQVKKWIGVFAVAMGGLVFAGGIGEYAQMVRARTRS